MLDPSAPSLKTTCVGDVEQIVPDWTLQRVNQLGQFVSQSVRKLVGIVGVEPQSGGPLAQRPITVERCRRDSSHVGSERHCVRFLKPFQPVENEPHHVYKPLSRLLWIHANFA